MMLNRKIGVREIWTVLATILLLGPLGMPNAEAGRRQERGDDNVIKLKDGKATINGDMKGKEDTYSIDLKKDQPYTISMNAQFDTFLRVTDKAGKLVALNDDISPNDLNSKLVFKPTESSRFNVIATSFDGSGRGPYTLRVEEGGTPSGQVVKVELKDGKFAVDGNMETQVDLYLFQAKQSERYVINMTSQKFDTFLVIIDMQKKAIAKDDDGGEGLNSRLVFEPPATGSYFIGATSFGATGRGEYHLSIVREGK